MSDHTRVDEKLTKVCLDYLPKIRDEVEGFSTSVFDRLEYLRARLSFSFHEGADAHHYMQELITEAIRRGRELEEICDH